VRSRVVRIRDISPDDEASWRRLAERAVEPNPFAEPDFFVLAVRHFEGFADASLVIVEDGPDFVAALPIAACTRPRLPPRRVASTGADPKQISGLQTPLIDRGAPDRAVGGLLDGLHRAARNGEWPGVVLLEECGTDGPVGEALMRQSRERGCPVHVKDTWERGTVTRAGKWESPFDGKRRREIGRKQRMLTEHLGAEVTLVDRSRDGDALEGFFEMEASGWKGRDGGHAFARYPGMADWFREWHSRLSAAGRVTLLSLHAGTVPIAMSYFIRAGEGLICFRSAIDEEYSKYGPGAMLVAAALTFLRESTDAAWMDSMTWKDNAFFLGLMPERRTLSSLLIGTGGALDRAAVSALPTLERLVEVRHRVQGRMARAAKTPVEASS
jgi:CelD/BcsL family acetyltransferase involved in cellulose biosynthesis